MTLRTIGFWPFSVIAMGSMLIACSDDGATPTQTATSGGGAISKSCAVGQDCDSGFCVDGVCCSTACTGTCLACNTPGNVGTCSNVPAGQSDANEGCSGSATCNGSGACINGNGQACSVGSECASGFCADGACCDSECFGACKACTAAKKGSGMDGVCGDITNGTDPDDDCADQGPASCQQDGTCNGSGACRWYAMGTVCLPGDCTDGVQTSAGTCNGSGVCDGSDVVTGCAPYVCGANACFASCSIDAQCVAGYGCNAGQCTPICGDGIKAGGELCDDGNGIDGDGCSAVCNVENGWTCVGPFSLCSTACGDGIKVGDEECDDGNTSDADNCSATCVLQEVLEVVAGQYHTCARLSHGVVKCWGDNSYGMLGVGDTFTRGNDPWDMGSQLPTLDLGTGIPARS